MSHFHSKKYGKKARVAAAKLRQAAYDLLTDEQKEAQKAANKAKYNAFHTK